MPYEIQEHKHRYAAWAASRAASTSTCRFNVRQGKKIIEEIGLKDFVDKPELLPSPSKIDVEHKRWREDAILAAKRMSILGF